MRVHCMSDLHFEHMTREGSQEFFKRLKRLRRKDPASLLILAGDICQIGRHEGFWRSRLSQLCEGYEKVLFVPGNHEYYESSFRDVERFMDEVAEDPSLQNLVQLSNGPFEFKHRRFVGDTMWFPEGEDDFTKRMMHDFKVIGNRQSPFEPEVYRKHDAFKLKVLQGLRSSDVIVTHHTPLKASIHEDFKGSPINRFFCADIESQLKEESLPKVWIHGHTHTPFDYNYRLGAAKMRVYCNPLAYPFEPSNPRFWNRVAIDI